MDTNDQKEGTTPVLAHLSRSQRGFSHRLSGNEVRIGTGPGMHIRLPLDTEPLPRPHHATLRSRGLAYEVVAEGGSDVWVNGERVSRFTLASGGVLEIGRDGAVLRYRVYDPGVAPYKTMTQVFADCLDCARQSDRGPAGKAAMVFTDLPKQLATQTAHTFRVGVLTVLILLGAGTGLLARRRAGRATRGHSGASPHLRRSQRSLFRTRIERFYSTGCAGG